MSLLSRIIPLEGSSDSPSFKIFSDGDEIKSSIQIVSIGVSRSINKISTAKLVIIDGDISKETFEISSKDYFVPGKEIKIELGYEQKNTTVFTGIVIKHALKARQKQPSYLIVELKDPAVKMTVLRKNAFYTKSSDSDIIEEVISNNGLDNDVEFTRLIHKEMVQFNCTDWDFIVSRAEVNGKFVYTEDGNVKVKKPNFIQKPVVLLTYGSSIIEFEAELDATNQFDSVKSYSWDFSSQDIKDADSTPLAIKELGNISSDDLVDVLGNDEFELFHTGSIVDSELQAWSNAKIQKSKLSKIRGRVKFNGFSKIMPGDLILLNGLGDRFNGLAFVSGIRHEMNAQDYTTNVEFGVPYEWFSKANESVSEMAASGLLPSVSGLLIGVVSQLENDPDGESRVKVKIPIINESDEGIWARIVSPDAGQNKGSFFLPDVGDEVVIGFLNDDPRYPIVLGALYSSGKTPPFTVTDDNYDKGIITKAGMKITINDEKKILIIETPNKNMITISDEDKKISIVDENMNKIEMSADGIVMESGKDLSIKATGDIKVEGVNISFKANGEFKAEGSSGAELSTTATAVLKGSVVQIN